MTAIDDLYHAQIVRHDRLPRNCGPLPAATHTATLDNPLCGDIITIRMIVRADHIHAIAFEARGCALSRAAASMMTDRVTCLGLVELPALAARFERFLAEPIGAPIPDDLGDLVAFRGLRSVRSRRSCATLPFRALAKAADSP